MGRKKIDIVPITKDQNRQITFTKRKSGLFKKAYELNVLCGAEISVIIKDQKGKVYTYGSNGDGVHETILSYCRTQPVKVQRENNATVQTRVQREKDKKEGNSSPPPGAEGSTKITNAPSTAAAIAAAAGVPAAPGLSAGAADTAPGLQPETVHPPMPSESDQAYLFSVMEAFMRSQTQTPYSIQFSDPNRHGMHMPQVSGQYSQMLHPQIQMQMGLQMRAPVTTGLQMPHMGTHGLGANGLQMRAPVTTGANGFAVSQSATNEEGRSGLPPHGQHTKLHSTYVQHPQLQYAQGAPHQQQHMLGQGHRHGYPVTMSLPCTQQTMQQLAMQPAGAQQQMYASNMVSTARTSVPHSSSFPPGAAQMMPQPAAGQLSGGRNAWPLHGFANAADAADSGAGDVSLNPRSPMRERKQKRERELDSDENARSERRCVDLDAADTCADAGPGHTPVVAQMGVAVSPQTSSINSAAVPAAPPPQG